MSTSGPTSDRDGVDVGQQIGASEKIADLEPAMGVIMEEAGDEAQDSSSSGSPLSEPPSRTPTPEPPEGETSEVCSDGEDDPSSGICSEASSHTPPNTKQIDNSEANEQAADEYDEERDEDDDIEDDSDSGLFSASSLQTLSNTQRTDDSETEGQAAEENDDSRAAFDLRVQNLLIGLRDEIGVDLLLMSGQHDDPECLAVKGIWLERKIANLTQQVRDSNMKIKDMEVKVEDIDE